MIYECEDITRTIDDYLDEFENLGFLIQERNESNRLGRLYCRPS
jgi:hypothetical protein